jgi:hypothetical protein
VSKPKLQSIRVNKFFKFLHQHVFFVLLAKPSSLLISLPEIQKSFGSDATVGGIKFQFATRIKADVKLINDAKAAGIDCKDITLGGAVRSEGKGGKGQMLLQFSFQHVFLTSNVSSISH